MSELLATKSGVVNADEISRASRGFNARQLSDSRIKQRQRDRVIEHIIRYHDPTMPLRFVGLPGELWETEKQLAERHARDSFFLGFEWNWRTASRSYLHMPGSYTAKPYCLDLEIGTIEGFTTDASRLLYCHLASFLSLQRTERVKSQMPASTKKRWLEQYAKIYKSNSCAWLDFTGNLCKETLTAMQHLGSHISFGLSIAPVVITLMLGRETDLSDADTVLDRRIPAVVNALNQSKWRRFALTEAWTYTSDGGCPMGMFAGVFAKRS